MNKRTPLIDLHCHLDGSITADIARSLARIQSIALPAEDDEELNRLLSVGEDCKSLNDFLKCFELPLSLLQTEAGIRECIHLVQENIKNDGVVYLEIRFAPQLSTQKKAYTKTGHISGS